MTVDNLREKIQKELCPYCQGRMDISKLRRKIKGKWVRTGEFVKYCIMDGCDYEKILEGTEI